MERAKAMGTPNYTLSADYHSKSHAITTFWLPLINNDQIFYLFLIPLFTNQPPNRCYNAVCNNRNRQELVQGPSDNRPK